MQINNTYKIIFGILLVLLLVLIGYYFLSKESTGNDGGTVSTFKNFFPFGGDDSSPEVTTEPEVTEPENIDQPVDITKKLRKLSSEPVAGAGLLDVKAGTIVRYIEKATGHIFEVELFSPRQGRISNTTIPKVYDAVWGNKNNSLITRYLNDEDYSVDTFSLSLKDTSTTTEETISGIAFPKKIDDVTAMGNSVFYLEKNENSSVGYISNFAGGNKKIIWNSPIKELLSQYVNTKTVSLTTKPEENTDGFMYFVDTNNATFRKILGNIKGLSTNTNPDATKIIYLKQGNSFGLVFHDITKKVAEVITPETFPEKCVWSTKNKDVVYCAVPKDILQSGSLTMWYKGLIQYSDDIWKYDTKNRVSEIITDLSKEGGESIDVIKPILSENEQYILFINKRDNSLWSLDINN